LIFHSISQKIEVIFKMKLSDEHRNSPLKGEFRA